MRLTGGRAGRYRAEALAGEIAAEVMRAAEQIGRAMERATVCLDEIDKVSGLLGGKPYVTGINIQQAVLTLIEGERVPHRITAPNQNGEIEATSAWVDTGKMLFLCAGAFETLYDQVFTRVTSAKSGVKLPTVTTYINGKIQIREYFTLRHHFRQEDLFEYGMQPQFLSRFDNAVILEDLNAGTLSRIFRETDESGPLTSTSAGGGNPALPAVPLNVLSLMSWSWDPWSLNPWKGSFRNYLGSREVSKDNRRLKNRISTRYMPALL